MNNTPPKPIRTRLYIPGNFIAVYPATTFAIFMLSILTILLIAAFH